MLTYLKDTATLIGRAIVRKLIERFRDPLILRATMTPYSHLDNGEYMLRYWLVPYAQANKPPERREPGCGPVSFFHRPVAWALQKLGIAIRVHGIMRSDSDRAYHDHPWNFVSVILDGAYWEHRPVYDLGLFSGESAERFETGSVIFRRAADLHRLEVPDGQVVWTLFITGPWKQNWGFVADPGYKVPWKEYLAANHDLKPAEVPATKPVEPSRSVWVMCRCKECNGLTCAGRFEIPRETGEMQREVNRLDKDNRYPITGIYSKEMAWCHCDDAKDESFGWENIPKDPNAPPTPTNPTAYRKD